MFKVFFQENPVLNGKIYGFQLRFPNKTNPIETWQKMKSSP